MTQTMLTIDGSYGEGGGQVLRTSLVLSAVLGRPVRIVNIRAGRKNPGLAPQHLTGVRAIARVCNARVEGAELRSTALTFVPQGAPQPGEYRFDVAEAAKSGSAGATSLVFQTLFLPLALATGDSHLTLEGGTHVAWSPPFHYLAHVFLPMVRRMGLDATVELERWGWYPIGRGMMHATIRGCRGREHLEGINLTQRGELRRLWGISALSNLPKHIGQRQKKAAEVALKQHGFEAQVRVIHGPAHGRGTAVFLVAEYEGAVAGFTALGERGKPAEVVAREAVDEFLRYHASGQALDHHLADQLILPMALARSPSAFTTCEITQHLLTNCWVVEQFLPARFEIEGEEGQPGRVTCRPQMRTEL
jgi:RNA 3'-terminal phosphate cyclase (ATP)